MDITSFLDPDTETYTHVLVDGTTSQCAVFDPVLGFSMNSGRTDTVMADQVITFIKQRELTLIYLIETHAHADHLSSAPYIKKQLGGQIVIGERITDVQHVFKAVFNLGDNVKTDASQFDVLTTDGQVLTVGNLSLQAIHVPGHTPADMAYVVREATPEHDPEEIAIFAGDTLFASDVGTARCDFPGGDAGTLYDSIQTLLSLPDHSRIYLCHDYPPSDEAGNRTREYQAYTTVFTEKEKNKHVKQGTTKADFISMRTTRDKGLNAPRYMIPSVQVNINAGHLPVPEDNGVRYSKIPLNRL